MEGTFLGPLESMLSAASTHPGYRTGYEGFGGGNAGLKHWKASKVVRLDALVVSDDGSSGLGVMG